MNMQQEHEIRFVNSFIVAERRERWIGFLQHPRKRPKVTETLWHYKDLDRRYFVEIPGEDQGARRVFNRLKKLHAPSSSWLISATPELDESEMELREALDRVVGMLNGTIISCIPGQLAYFESEEPANRYILHKS